MAMTETSPKPFTGPHWTDALREELRQAEQNGQVGSRIVSETERVRVWLIEMQPGERLGSQGLAFPEQVQPLPTDHATRPGGLHEHPSDPR